MCKVRQALAKDYLAQRLGSSTVYMTEIF